MYQGRGFVMYRHSVGSAAAAAAVATQILACTSPPGDDAAESETPSDIASAAPIHVYPRRTGAAQPVLETSPTGPNMLRYYGGKVIARPTAYAINWNASVDSRVLPKVAGFYAAALDSPYTQWLTEYNTLGVTPVDGGASSNQRFGRGSLGGQFTLTPRNTATALTDLQVQQEIAHQIDIGALPPPTDQAYYAVNFPTGISISLSGLLSCFDFCGYHGTFNRSGQDVYYAVLPSLAPGSACNVGCGDAPSFLDNTTSVASHELVEAMTDAEVGLTPTVQRPLAWYSTSGGEIGDICNAAQGSIVGADSVTYTVQKQYDNESGTCIVSKPPAATIWAATGAPCVGSSCPGWQLLDNNPHSARIASSSTALYQLHDTGEIWRYTGTACAGGACPGWQRIDANPATIGIFADGSELYQLHSTGMIWRYTGTPCTGGTCPGWQPLDNNPATMNLVAAGGQLFQMHRNGEIWRYTGTPCAGGACLGWQLLDNNPASVALASDGATLYQLHSTGAMWRYTGTPCAGGSCPGWQLIDNNAGSVGIVAGGGRLFQLHASGTIWRYTGTPCSGGSCLGWQQLDNNPATMAIATDGTQLLQLHDTGDVWRYTGTPCAGGACLGWQRMDDNPATGRISAFGTGGYQMHTSRTSMTRRRVCYDCRP
jgi:hypothetical protein